MIEAATKLEEAIQQAPSQYFRLVILAGPPASGKTAALQAVAKTLDCQIVNVNLELSKKMLALTRSKRSQKVASLLKEVIAAASGEVVLLDNLEILFDSALDVEPLRILQLASRNRTIVASWNGNFANGTLSYAEPGHPEFLQEKQTEAVVISTAGADTN